MCSQILNTLGLMLNIVGVATLWRFGFPQPTHEESTGLAIEGPIADKNAEGARRKKAKYICISTTALVLIILGFLCQLIATWVK
jgi:hypothetical protein